MDFSQSARLIGIDTILGEDVLLPIDLSVEDAVSEAFCASVTMFSSDTAIAPETMIGTRATLWIGTEPATRIPVNGVVTRFSERLVDRRGLREYRAEIRPWLWLLTCTNDCRIFQNRTFPDTIGMIFAEYGFDEYELRLMADYKPIDYCVQYRESVFAFLSRWMEKLGIFYYWRHTADRHVMVISDQNTGFIKLDDATVDCTGSGHGNVDRWERASSFRPGRYAHTDYSFKSPAQNLLAQQRSLLPLALSERFEIFDFPAGHTELADGQALARLRIEEEEAQYQQVRGSSGCHHFQAGARVGVSRHDIRAEEGASYILTRISHSAHDESFYASGAAPPSYRNTFIASPATTRYRPRRITPWPVVYGPQTALVVGTPGETIFTDARGRVKLQFHWDRRGSSDEKSSCWVRVSQNTAGAGWGGVFIPHVGHEVVVSFLEGDPDRPLVTGRVYNEANTKAIALPANKTQSGLRDHSGNEILMEGKAEAQNIRITATRDKNVIVAHDYNEVVTGGNRMITIASGTHTETIKGNTTIRVTNGNFVHRIEAGTAQYFVSGNVTENYNDHHTANVNSDVIINSLYSKIFLQAAMAIQLTSGASQVTLDKDGTISIVGKTIKIIGNQSVSVSGDQVGITGGTQTQIGVGNQNTTYDKQKVAHAGASISSSATGEHDITGAVVKIN